jgi:hypothetical protein
MLHWQAHLVNTRGVMQRADPKEAGHGNEAEGEAADR